jgi:hypothetical protein
MSARTQEALKGSLNPSNACNEHRSESSYAQSTMTGNVIAPWASTSSGVMKSYGDNYFDALPGPTAIPKG